MFSERGQIHGVTRFQMVVEALRKLRAAQVPNDEILTYVDIWANDRYGATYQSEAPAGRQPSKVASSPATKITDIIFERIEDHLR